MVSGHRVRRGTSPRLQECPRALSPRQKACSPRQREISPCQRELSPRQERLSPRQYSRPDCGGRGRLPSLDEAIPEMSHLRKDSSCELARRSCQLQHDPRGPHASISPHDQHFRHDADCRAPKAASADNESPYSRYAEPGFYGERSRSSSYYGDPRYDPTPFVQRSLHGAAIDSQRDLSPQYDDHPNPALRSMTQLPIHPGPPNRNSYSSSSSTDISDRRTSLASGSTATTHSGPTDRRGRSNGNSPEPRMLPPIRTCEPWNRTREQTRILAQGPTAFDSAECRVENAGFETRRNSMLLGQPYYEHGRERCYEHVRESVEYTRDSRDILQPVIRKPASRQPVNRQPVNRHHENNRQSVNFAKPDEKTKRRRGNLPKAVTETLKKWFQDHIAHPYPSEDEKQKLMDDTGLSMSQVSNWFINARRRNLPQLNKQAAAESALREMQGETDRKRSE